MNLDFPLTLAGGGIAGLGFLLLLARLPNSQWQKSLLRAAAGWSQTTNAKAMPLLVAVFGIAAMLLSAKDSAPRAWAAVGELAANGRTDVPSTARTGEVTTDEALNVLRDYVGSIVQDAAPAQSTRDAASPQLPDVETMIARLAARLANEPGDIEGWRTLGWSYAHTDHFAEAVKAYETALALDPSNVELKDALEMARQKVMSGAAGSEAAATPAN